MTDCPWDAWDATKPRLDHTASPRKPPRHLGGLAGGGRGGVRGRDARITEASRGRGGTHSGYHRFQISLRFVFGG